MIIDTFLLSEPYENDLLYLKFLLEDSQVNCWIIQENHYTTQGEYKGVFAQEILQEERFKPYHHKIIICSGNEQHGTENNEGVNFAREKWQRTLCLGALQQIANPQDRIIVSDIDELIDFSDENRTKKFFEMTSSEQIVWINRMRYWYDYDNRCYIYALRIPVIPYSILISYPQVIMEAKLANSNPLEYPPYKPYADPIAFEYSYVFKSINDIWRKKTTFAHNNYVYDCLKIGLECNHFPSSPLRGDSQPGTHPHDWLEKVELNETNSPKYVRDNLEILKTNIVDPNYKENRIKRYG